MTAATDTDTNPKAGRPRSPLDVADARELNRIAALASSVLICLRAPGKGHYESERTLRQWLSDDGIASTAADLSPALGLLEATGKLGRGPEAKNSPRAGWLPAAAEAAAWTSEAVEAPVPSQAAEPTSGPVAATGSTAAAEDVTEPPELTEEVRINALATAIVKAIRPGRGFQGNVSLCESEAVLRQWLQADNVVWDEADLPAAFTRLETATMPGATSRLLRGYALHRSYPITARPLPKRAMQLVALHPFDRLEYPPADIEPYVV